MFRKYVRLRIDKHTFLLYIDNRTVVREHAFDKRYAKVEEEKREEQTYLWIDIMPERRDGNIVTMQSSVEPVFLDVF